MFSILEKKICIPSIPSISGMSLDSKFELDDW